MKTSSHSLTFYLFKLFATSFIIGNLLSPTFDFAFAQCNCLGYYEPNNLNARIAHHHETSICVGYAFSSAISNMGSPIEPRSTIFIDVLYARKYWEEWGFFEIISNPQTGCIAIWDNPPGNNIEHAAVIVGYDGGWRVNQVDGHGGPLEEGVLITDWNDQMPNFYLSQIKSTYGYTVTVKTSFNEGKIKADGIEYDSGRQFSWGKNSSHELAVKRRQYASSYWRVYRNWIDLQYPYNPLAIEPDSVASIEINMIKTFQANFIREFNIIFQNNFICVGNPGTIKVSNAPYSSPTSEFYVLDGSTIIGEAINQIYNSISYTFSHWSDSVNTYPQTFPPNGHKTYTAHFTGKPVRVQNLHNVAPIGSPIQLVWDEHPNSNCTYQIWRRVKELYGTQGDPVLLAIKPHGTTSYTDIQYLRTSSYTEYLLSYDVRAYYTVESATADPWWYTLYGGDPLWKDPAARDSLSSQLPTTVGLANYPNPFNSSTAIIYQLPQDAFVKISIYDLRGCLVKTLLEGPRPAGVHTVRWNGVTEAGHSAASGVYILRLESPDYNIARKVLLAR